MNSEVTSQILYGEKFKILSKKKNWVKIKTSFDHYTGYIKKEKFYLKFKPTHKVYRLRSKIFKKKSNKFISTDKFLYFASGVLIKNKEKKYIEFEKNFVKILKLFLNTKYMWGGRTSEGIDCSALIQIYFYYNRFFFPRDTKAQIKFCKRKSNKKFSKGDIIFWRGHVGMCVSKSQFIHAYGPKKKVLIMPINFALRLIKKTAKLKIISIKRF